MKRKLNKGFTLVELIVVIAIIGILAAVLVPSIMGYIEKARYSNDVTDAKNMSTILQANAVDVNMSKLEAPDVRNIINSSDKNYSFIPRSKNAHFWYNVETRKIEVTDSLEASQLYAAGGFVPKSVEEVFEGKLYLNVKGDLATALNTIRNLNSNAQYGYFDTHKNFNNVNISHIIDEFNPEQTLFVNAQGGFTNTNVPKKIKKVVFADHISVIPNMDVLMVQMLGTGKSFESNVDLILPYSVQLVMPGAFSTTTATFKVSKNTPKKIQVLENAFNVPTTTSNFIAKPNQTYDEYLEKVKYGNTFIDVMVHLNNIENYNTGLPAEFVVNNSIILRPGTAHTELEVKTQVEDYLMLNSTKRLSATKIFEKVDVVKISLKTDRFMLQFPNITSISASYYSNTTGSSFINFIASDPTGVVVNLTIRTYQK